MKTTREKVDNMQEMMDSREEEMEKVFSLKQQDLDEQLRRLTDQKEKLRLLDEKEKKEREEFFEIRMREIDEREKEIDKRERDVRQMKTERQHAEFVSNINRLAPQNIYNRQETKEYKVNNSPLPPKLSTFDGKTEWKPYSIQFNHMAHKYSWNEKEKLDKLTECLRDKALKIFSSRPDYVQKNFELLCQKLKDRFDKKDQPHIIRRQLHDIKQMSDETVEEFAERIEELSVEAYPKAPEYFRNTITIDSFLRGCTEKRPALVTLDKDQKILNEAVQHMKSAISNQKLIMGIPSTKEVKRVTFDENDDTQIEPPEEIDVRFTNKTSLQKLSLETRISNLEKDNKETKRMLREILERLRSNDEERESRSRFRQASRSPTRANRSPTRSNSNERESECYRCGELGHFARNCLQNTRSRSPSPNRSFTLSPKKSTLNSQELRK